MERVENRIHSLSFILTNKCNLKCSYCYEINKGYATINVDFVKQTIGEHFTRNDVDEIRIVFFGGEPFLEFNLIKEICEWVWSKEWEKKYHFFTVTNGTLIHGKIKDWLKINKDRFSVKLSLDGNRDSHNLNRSNSFDLIDISFFKENWGDRPVSMTISEETIHHLYNNIVYIHSLGLKVGGSNFADGIDWGNDKYKQILIEQLEKLCVFYINNPDVIPAPIINMHIYKCEEEKKKRKWCGCGEYMSAFDTDGGKHPCSFFSPMTFNKDHSLKINQTDWSNADILVDNDCFDNCYLEPACRNCYAANYLKNGEFNIRDKSKCELMKVRAVFSAALAAHKLVNNPIDNYKNSLTIKAIQKINNLFNKN
ncbi:radical SAM protein [Parabacteroides sp. PF5-9]|uniref:radical SAM protein n=1 Tax=Parabacteroides sp. PF5-9 TaxID=1742404 RepID=UPI0024764DE5|nr:radical SAM protein [Parabacteroides sp. PF5-9]MDH6357792.1 uncharacterized protein [Parabacteroides sp. PF5-9]